MTDSLDPSSHYLDAAGARYAAGRHAPHDSVAWEIESAWFLPHIKPADSVLDFGCATGGLTLRIAHAAREVHGLEVNPTSREIAERAGLRVYASADQIPAAQRYDVVLTNHVLEHVRDVCATLETLASHIRPGGLLLAKLPIDDIRSRYQRAWDRHDPDWHLHTWTPRLFANVLHEAGLEPLHIRILTSAWDPRILWLRRIGLGRPAFWALAILLHRRQLFAVARVPEHPPAP